VRASRSWNVESAGIERCHPRKGSAARWSWIRSLVEKKALRITGLALTSRCARAKRSWSHPKGSGSRIARLRLPRARRQKCQRCNRLHRSGPRTPRVDRNDSPKRSLRRETQCPLASPHRWAPSPEVLVLESDLEVGRGPHSTERAGGESLRRQAGSTRDVGARSQVRVADVGRKHRGHALGALQSKPRPRGLARRNLGTPHADAGLGGRSMRIRCASRCEIGPYSRVPSSARSACVSGGAVERTFVRARGLGCPRVASTRSPSRRKASWVVRTCPLYGGLEAAALAEG